MEGDLPCVPEDHETNEGWMMWKDGGLRRNTTKRELGPEHRADWSDNPAGGANIHFTRGRHATQQNGSRKTSTKSVLLWYYYWTTHHVST